MPRVTMNPLLRAERAAAKRAREHLRIAARAISAEQYRVAESRAREAIDETREARRLAAERGE